MMASQDIPAYRVISIGTLAAHPLWDEQGEVRSGHATCTLVSVGDRHILVNPGLPVAALRARLQERTNVKVDQITDVFLTCFSSDHRRGLALFEHARWLLHEPEREAAHARLGELLHKAQDVNDDELVRWYQDESVALDRFESAPEPPEKIAQHVDLFPLPGPTPGTCGLLLPLPRTTVLICGDAVPTVEHLEKGQVLNTCVDVEQARESFREAVEIADVLVPGRDNVVMNPLRAGVM